MESNYSLADLGAVLGNKDGGFGGMGGMGILFLFFLLFILGRNGWGGNMQDVMSKVGVDPSSAQQVSALAETLSTDTIQAAIAGNKDAINAVAMQLGTTTSTIQSTIAQASSLSQQSFATLSAAVNSCCCNIRQEMASGFGNTNTNMLQGFNSVNTTLLTQVNALDKELCAFNTGLQASVADLKASQILGNEAVKDTLLQGFADNKFANELGVNRIIEATTSNTNRILDALTNDRIQTLQEKLAQCSQDSQTAQIIAAINGQNSCNGRCC